jgi:hypothetical protein
LLMPLAAASFRMICGRPRARQDRSRREAGEQGRRSVECRQWLVQAWPGHCSRKQQKFTTPINEASAPNTGPAPCYPLPTLAARPPTCTACLLK